MSESVAKALLRARSILIRDGWTNLGSYRGLKGERCVMSAIDEATRYEPGLCEFSEAEAALMVVLGRQLDSGKSPAVWNDRQPHGRCVLNALEAAARIARAG
jgi:hypothetical protein